MYLPINRRRLALDPERKRQLYREMGITDAQQDAFNERRRAATEELWRRADEIRDDMRRRHAAEHHTGAFETCDDCQAVTRQRLAAMREQVRG